MKHRHEMFFLAVVLSTAAPVFADKTPANFTEGEKGQRGSVSMQGLPNKNDLQVASTSRNLGLNTFKEDEFRIESNPAVLLSDSNKDGKISGLDAALSSGEGPNNRQASLFDLDSIQGNSFGRDYEIARGKHNGRDWDDGDGPLSVVAIPEPGSLTLLLFGLAGLGIIVYRRNALKNAI